MSHACVLVVGRGVYSWNSVYRDNLACVHSLKLQIIMFLAFLYLLLVTSCSENMETCDVHTEQKTNIKVPVK